MHMHVGRHSWFDYASKQSAPSQMTWVHVTGMEAFEQSQRVLDRFQGITMHIIVSFFLLLHRFSAASTAFSYLHIISSFFVFIDVQAN
jgi:hypothetical protein